MGVGLFVLRCLPVRQRQSLGREILTILILPVLVLSPVEPLVFQFRYIHGSLEIFFHEPIFFICLTLLGIFIDVFD